MYGQCVQPNGHVQKRIQDLVRLSLTLRDERKMARFIDAYIEDTAFVRTDVYQRELIAPAAVLESTGQPNPFVEPFGVRIEARAPVGKVAVLLPKNGLGLTMCKSIAAAYLMGNDTIVHLPRQLSTSGEIYRRILREHLPGLEFAPRQQSPREFLLNCLRRPDVTAVVIYGDDGWIDGYWSLAKETLTKVIFEGPGNDPLIVFPDADVTAAVGGAVRCGLNNGGQSCSALERFFVHTAIEKEFTEGLVEDLKQLRLGSPTEPGVNLGPIASSRVFRRIQEQVEEAVTLGARLILGGQAMRSDFRDLPIYQPTVLTNCRTEMAVVRDETFGPVFPIITFDDVESLRSMVGDTKYGLNASVYGTCPPEFAQYLESSHRNVYYDSTCVDPQNRMSRVLDGGYKRSGIIWEQKGNHYVQREGKRYLVKELSVPNTL
jgi:acyl-CoA reductase-like NAD-dependent aldehyde dehydrogenase